MTSPLHLALLGLCGGAISREATRVRKQFNAANPCRGVAAVRFRATPNLRARLVVILLATLLASSDALAQIYSIKDFGAVADNQTMNTAAIQRAIDACSAAGGGEVQVTAGIFLTGSIILKSDITLRLLPGAVLQGSYQPADYPDYPISSHQKFGTITHDLNNPKAHGRDHHPRAFTMWLAGGGVKPGTIYGSSDDFAYHVAKDPVHVHDLQATLLHLCGIDHTRLTYRYQGRDFRLTDVHGELVKGILA